MELIKFLQNYNGAVTAISTVVLTATTIWIAVLTAALAKENRLLRRAGTEPDVVAYLIPDHRHFHMINLVIANVGKGPARNVSVEYTADFDDLTAHKVATMFKGKRRLASVLPQDERITSFFGSAIELLAGDAPMKDFSVIASFEDTIGRERRSTSTASIEDLKHLRRIGQPPEKEIIEALKKISDELRRR